MLVLNYKRTFMRFWGMGMRKNVLLLMVVCVLHLAALPIVNAVAATQLASSKEASHRAELALAEVKTFDDAVGFFYSHQLMGVGASMADLLQRHGISPKEALPKVQLLPDRIIAGALKKPVVITSTHPLVLHFGSKKWTPDSGKSLNENLESLLVLLTGSSAKTIGFLEGGWLIPSAQAATSGEKAAIGIGVTFYLMILASYLMDTEVSEAVTFTAAVAMLGLGGEAAYLSGKSFSEAILRIVAKAGAAGNVPYLPSEVVSCDPGEVKFRRAEVGSTDAFSLRVNAKADGTPATLSFVNGNGSPLDGMGGPYSMAERKVSAGRSELGWLWSKEAEGEISAKLGLPKGIRMDPATLENAVKKPENREFAEKIGSATLFFDLWQRACAGKSKDLMAKENERLGLFWKNVDKAKAAYSHPDAEAPAEKPEAREAQ
jgi:hypothetical protein